MDAPRTLQQAILYFGDPDRAFQYALNLRWPNGVVACPRCGSERHAFIKTRRIWECYGCKKQFSLKVGTIMEDSALGLDKWMMAAWMIAACKNGVSSYEIARSIGVTQKSAWFLLHRLREAMQGDSSEKLGGRNGGPVEVDETFVGGNPKNMHRAVRLRRKNGVEANKKISVMGMLDRKSREVRAKVIPNVRRETLQTEILNQIQRKSTVYTDGWAGYDSLTSRAFVHETVNHLDEYVRGEIHTQGIENFWSLLKRTLKGTYVAVEPYHLDRYVTEQVFRFNNRKTTNDQGRFELVMGNVAGKRLTYKDLTGAGSATAH